MEIGLYTFAELQEDPHDGSMISPQQRMRDLIEEAELADQVGLDVFGVGSTTAPTSSCRRPPWSWPPSARAPSTSG